jgi:hypothetical protein
MSFGKARGKMIILEYSRGIFVNIEYLEGLCVKRQGYLCKLDEV